MITATRRSTRDIAIGTRPAGPKITVFHCTNALTAPLGDERDFQLETVQMPCSSMTREVFLLRAFEAGADAVAVLVCPEGSCRYLEGNIRAARRVARVKKLLDEIGLDGRRLNIFHVAHGDDAAVEGVISKMLSELESLGPNPAA